MFEFRLLLQYKLGCANNEPSSSILEYNTHTQLYWQHCSTGKNSFTGVLYYQVVQVRNHNNVPGVRDLTLVVWHYRQQERSSVSLFVSPRTNLTVLMSLFFPFPFLSCLIFSATIVDVTSPCEKFSYKQQVLWSTLMMYYVWNSEVYTRGQSTPFISILAQRLCRHHHVTIAPYLFPFDS